MPAGLVYALIVAMWLAVLVPMWVRRHDSTVQARSLERHHLAMDALSPGAVPSKGSGLLAGLPGPAMLTRMRPSFSPLAATFDTPRPARLERGPYDARMPSSRLPDVPATRDAASTHREVAMSQYLTVSSGRRETLARRRRTALLLGCLTFFLLAAGLAKVTPRPLAALSTVVLLGFMLACGRADAVARSAQARSRPLVPQRAVGARSAASKTVAREELHAPGTLDLDARTVTWAPEPPSGARPAHRAPQQPARTGSSARPAGEQLSGERPSVERQSAGRHTAPAVAPAAVAVPVAVPATRVDVPIEDPGPPAELPRRISAPVVFEEPDSWVPQPVPSPTYVMSRPHRVLDLTESGPWNGARMVDVATEVKASRRAAEALDLDSILERRAVND